MSISFRKIIDFLILIYFPPPTLYNEVEICKSFDLTNKIKYRLEKRRQVIKINFKYIV